MKKKCIFSLLVILLGFVSPAMAINIGTPNSGPVEMGQEVRNGDFTTARHANSIIKRAIDHLIVQVKYHHVFQKVNKRIFEALFSDEESRNQFYQFLHDNIELLDAAELSVLPYCVKNCDLTSLKPSDVFAQSENGRFYFSPHFLSYLANEYELGYFAHIRTVDQISRLLLSLYILEKNLLNVNENTLAAMLLFSSVDGTKIQSIKDTYKNLEGDEDNTRLGELHQLAAKVLWYELSETLINQGVSNSIGDLQLAKQQQNIKLDCLQSNECGNSRSLFVNFFYSARSENTTEDRYIKLEMEQSPFGKNGLKQVYAYELKYVKSEAPKVMQIVPFHDDQVDETQKFVSDEERFLNASSILSEAQAQLMKTVDNERIKEIIGNFRPMTLVQFNQSSYQLRRFYYDRDEYLIFPTKSYYYFYGSYRSNLIRFYFIDKTKRLILHEALHLLGYGEEESFELSKSLLRASNEVDLETPTPLPVHIDMAEFDLIAKRFIDPVIEKAKLRLEKYINIKFGSDVVYRSKVIVKEYCFISRMKRSCSQSFDNKIFEYNISYFDSTNQKTVLTIPINFQLSFVSDKLNGAMLYMRTQQIDLVESNEVLVEVFQGLIYKIVPNDI